MDNPEEEAYFSKKATLLTVSPQATRVSLISTAPSLQSFIASRSNSKTWYEHLRFVITQNLHNVRKEGQTEGLTAKVILTSLLKMSVFTREKKSISNIQAYSKRLGKMENKQKDGHFYVQSSFQPQKCRHHHHNPLARPDWTVWTGGREDARFGHDILFLDPPGSTVRVSAYPRNGLV